MDRVKYFKHAATTSRTSAEAERLAFYNSSFWKRLRSAYLARHPLCVKCQEAGRIEAATVVHHIIERLQRPDLAYDWKNLQGLCAPCHTRHHKQGKRP